MEGRRDGEQEEQKGRDWEGTGKGRRSGREGEEEREPSLCGYAEPKEEAKENAQDCLTRFQFRSFQAPADWVQQPESPQEVMWTEVLERGALMHLKVAGWTPSHVLGCGLDPQ